MISPISGPSTLYHRLGADLCLYPIYRSICYKYGCSSLGEIFGKLFSKRVSVCVSVMIFVSFASAVSAQTVIVSNLLQSLLGIRSEVTMTVTIAAMILLALQGGMKGLAASIWCMWLYLACPLWQFLLR